MRSSYESTAWSDALWMRSHVLQHITNPFVWTQTLNPPGIPDPKPEKDPLELAISKCKQAMLLIEKTSMALDDDMAAVSKSKYMNPKLKTTFLAFMAKLSQAKNKLKANMNKAAQLDLDTFKTMITNGVAVVKEIQSFMKEHKAISSGASAMGKDDWYVFAMMKAVCCI